MPKKRLQKAAEAVRAFALGLPGATEDFPWGERVAKVDGKKVFVFLGRAEATDGWGLSVKLPGSSTMALGLPFVTPTGYGLGKSGWVTARFPPDEEPPVDLLTQWVEESYRAVAPKRRVKELDGRAAPESPERQRRGPGSAPAKRSAPRATAESPARERRGPGRAKQKSAAKKKRPP